MGEYKSLAESEVPKFHESLDSGRYDDLYSQSSDELKKVATKESFVKLVTAVHAKLGKVVEAKSTAFNVNYHTSGTFVTLTYDTAFKDGRGSETFVYQIINKKPILSGYWINSNDLITR
jgi:hypothetical protein